MSTIVKKVGGGDPQTHNKNWKLILDKSIRREGAKSVCQNFKNDYNVIKVLFCLCFYGNRVSIIGISGSKIHKGFVMRPLDVHS